MSKEFFSYFSAKELIIVFGSEKAVYIESNHDVITGVIV